MTGPLRLIEQVPIDDDLVTALSHVEDLGFGGRLVFYTIQTCFESGETLRIVKRKIVVPYEGLRLGNPIVRAFIEGTPSGAPLRRVK